MPTGYTANIEKGISFPEFALHCARAFGALIHMRDSASDAEIPDEIKPSEYHKIAIDEALIKLNEAKKMTLEEAKTKAEIERAEAIKFYEKYDDDKLKLLHKYKSMLHKVEMWQPPTPDHIEMKLFMMQQINSSIDFDCTIYPHGENKLKKSVAEWRQENIDKCAENLGYHVKEWEAEVQRCKDRTEWIRALRASLR